MGPLPVAAALAACPVALVVYAMWIARGEQMLHLPALLFGALVALAGIFAYLVSRPRRQVRSREL